MMRRAGNRYLAGTMRADKDFSQQAVRLAQLTGREAARPELVNRILPALEVMRREVYPKEVKVALWWERRNQ